MRLLIPFLKYQVMIIISNSLLPTLCNLIVRRVTKEGEFYKKYLDWSCVNKWSQVDSENIGSALTPLSITGVERLWMVSFLHFHALL